jgi:hypothetical protein
VCALTSTVCFNDLGKPNLLMVGKWLDFKLELIFATAQVAFINNAGYRGGQI